jgi:hypothetical protein
LEEREEGWGVSWTREVVRGGTYMTKSIPIPIVTDKTTSIHQIPHVNLSHLSIKHQPSLHSQLETRKTPWTHPLFRRSFPGSSVKNATIFTSVAKPMGNVPRNNDCCG